MKSEIPIRTWADWDEKAPGFVEIDLVGHEGGDPRGEFAQTLTVTDVFTGWTETKAVRNKAQKWGFEVPSGWRKGHQFTSFSRWFFRTEPRTPDEAVP